MSETKLFFAEIIAHVPTAKKAGRHSVYRLNFDQESFCFKRDRLAVAHEINGITCMAGSKVLVAKKARRNAFQAAIPS